MICLECGKGVRVITATHLKGCSGLTTKVYRERHPDATFSDEATRKSFGRSMEENPNWEGGKTIKHCQECEKGLSRNNKSGLCRSCARKGERNPFAGQSHSTETRIQMVKGQQARDPATRKYGLPDPVANGEARRRVWAKVTKEDRLLLLHSFILAGQHSKRSSRTKIENFVNGILAGAGFHAERNRFVGQYNVDFLVEGRFVIECYGNYWHCNPSLYAPDFYQKSLHMTAQEKWILDDKRRIAIQAMGFIFVRFWESDIQSFPFTVRETILDFLQEKRMMR